MSLQHETRSAKLTTILSRRAVVDGFNSIRKNLPFDYESCDKDAQYGWGYERGRLLAIVYKGPLKEGRYVTRGALEAWKQAKADGAIL